MRGNVRDSSAAKISRRIRRRVCTSQRSLTHDAESSSPGMLKAPREISSLVLGRTGALPADDFFTQRDPRHFSVAAGKTRFGFMIGSLPKARLRSAGPNAGS
jgi:hypothetical protein